MRYGKKKTETTCDIKRKSKARTKPFTPSRRSTPKFSVSEAQHSSHHVLRSEVKLWLEDLEDTWKVAKDNFTLGNYHVAAFYTHQSVEKVLKAAIMALKHKAPPKTHRLRLLYSEVASEVPLTVDQIRFLGELTPVARRTRYVDVAPGLPSKIYTKGIVEEYLEKALPIVEAVKARIKVEGDQE